MRIGLEVHVALPTKTKLFCGCSTEGDEPNTAICPTCLGFPGSKLMLNEDALSASLRVAKALHCQINEITYFLRKVYFYPDLPKSYQITQLEGAVGHDGYVDLGRKRIRIRRVQLEEDPAKIIREEEYSLLDFNRSGIPLDEIVTEPDIETEDDLREFVSELRSILYYAGVDIDKEMKVDLNISLGNERVEVKNVTGIKNLIDAERFEVKRQSNLIASGQMIAKETRSYNSEMLSTVSSREKESDEEYGFIYEPDLSAYPTLKDSIPDTVIASSAARQLSSKYGINEVTLKELVMFDRNALRLIQHGLRCSKAGTVINAIELLKRHNGIMISDKGFEKMLSYMDNGMLLNEDAIKALSEDRDIGAEKNAVSAEEIDNAIRDIVSSRQDLVNEYKSNSKAFNFIVGMVLKKYKVSPKYISERLAEFLKDKA